MQWTPGPRTMSEIREMSSQRVLWEEAWNTEHYNAALALPEKTKAHKDIDSQWKAKKFWDADTTGGSVTPDEYKGLTAEFKKFLDHYPQYKTPHADQNNDAMFGWLRDHHMAPIYSNLVLAFEATALAGQLWLNPSAIAAGSETEVLGTQHHNFHLLVQPQRRNPDDGLSAKQFLAQHDELKDKRTPPLIQAREQKDANTAEFFKQTQDATASTRNGKTRVVDYGPQDHGVPQSKKYSFRKLVDSMSSTELAQRCQQDPAFKKALDEME